jgi:hypothetical protein
LKRQEQGSSRVKRHEIAPPDVPIAIPRYVFESKGRTFDFVFDFIRLPGTSASGTVSSGQELQAAPQFVDRG